MLWSILFSIGIVQGLFLILVLMLRTGTNPLATRLLIALLLLFMLANVDDLLLSTGWYRLAPGLFGLSMNILFAYGVLLWWYIRAITDPTFFWTKRCWWHFLPFALATMSQIPFMLLPAEIKTAFLDTFLAGDLPLRPFGVVIFTVQLAHLLIYGWLIFHWLRQVNRINTGSTWHLPLPARVQWLRILAGLFALFFAVTLLLFCLTMAKGYYVPRANFFYTFVTSAILFFIAGKQALDPQLIVPGFSKKYQSGRLGSEVENGCLVELNRLLEEEKIFLQPDLKLSTLARQLGVAPQQLSMLINEKFGKSYTDLINQRRVEAFISFRKDPHYAHYSMLALAYEVGFNSKSAFNAAFKKATGMAPSDFLK